MPDSIFPSPSPGSHPTPQTSPAQAPSGSDEAPMVVRKSVVVGASHVNETKLFIKTDARGEIRVIEVACACGETHQILCEYPDENTAPNPSTIPSVD